MSFGARRSNGREGKGVLGKHHKTICRLADKFVQVSFEAIEKTPGRKNPNKIYQYRIARQLPIRDGNDALKVIYGLLYHL